MQKKLIYSARSNLTDISIEQCGAELHLKFNADGDAIQSAINREQPHQLVMQNLQYLMGILLFIPQPQKILMLGVGGGSLIHYLRHFLPHCEITAVEYNPQLMEVAFEHFQLPQTDGQLHYIVEDARKFVQQDTSLYDLIVMDIFEDDLSPPWLQQEGFIQHLKNRLSATGALTCNLLIDDEKKFKTFYRVFRKQFAQQALCLEAEEYENVLVYGLNFQAPCRSMSELLNLCWQLSDTYELPFSQILAAIYDINPTDSGII